MKQEYIELLYAKCKELYSSSEENTDSSTAEIDKELGKEIGATQRSVRTYRTTYNNLRDNKPFNTNLGMDILSYYISMFKDEVDNETFVDILKNMQNYLKERYRIKAERNNTLRELCKSYADDKGIDVDFSENIFDGIIPQKSIKEVHEMFALVDLSELVKSTKERFKQEFVPADVRLTDEFKQAYGEYLRSRGQNVEFNLTSAVITSSENNKMYVPSQWFTMATYVAPLISEILKYQKCCNYLIAEEYVTNVEKKGFYELIRKDTEGTIVQEFIEKTEKFLIEYKFSEEEVERLSNYICKFVSNDYKWWQGAKTIERTDIYVPSCLSLLGLVQNSQSYVAEIGYIFATTDSLKDAIKTLVDKDGVVMCEEKTVLLQDINRLTGAENLIVYGAPGTGKSRTLEDRYNKAGYKLIKIVFHPEYTYYDFVGSYKPMPVYKKTDDEYTTASGELFDKGEPYIDYRFVPGPFINALVEAWKNPEIMVTLLIDEINRANAAAVFGEVFQLLDRKANGESEYKIEPSYDLKTYLQGLGLSEFIENGIGIPSNMNIVASMNSADQGVNNMDAAFKRRWNYEYLKIDVSKATHRAQNIEYNRKMIPWGLFVSALNEKMKNDHVEEDRLIGPYFIKPDELGNSRALDKMLLYLWDDIYRHRRNTNNIFGASIKVFSDLVERFATDDVLLLSEIIDVLYADNMTSKLNITEETGIDVDNVTEDTIAKNEQEEQE